MRLGRPPGPMQLDVHPLAGLVDDDAHPLDQESGDPLPLGLGGRGGPPHRGEVARQGADHPLIFGGEPARGRPPPSLEFLLELPPPLQRFLPATLQLASDQAILRLAGLVLAGRPIDLMIRPLATQLPMPGQFGPFALHAGHRRQARLQRRRLDGREHPAGDHVVEGWARKALAERLAGARGATGTRVRVKILRPRIEDDHPSPATPATQQSGEQRVPLSRRARTLLAGPVGREPVLIGPKSSPVRFGVMAFKG